VAGRWPSCSAWCRAASVTGMTRLCTCATCWSGYRLSQRSVWRNSFPTVGRPEGERCRGSRESCPGGPAWGLSSRSPPTRSEALGTCTAGCVPRAGVVSGRYLRRMDQATWRPWDTRSVPHGTTGCAGGRRRDGVQRSHTEIRPGEPSRARLGTPARVGRGRLHSSSPKSSSSERR
jgi:hypothetical protein